MCAQLPIALVHGKVLPLDQKLSLNRKLVGFGLVVTGAIIYLNADKLVLNTALLARVGRGRPR